MAHSKRGRILSILILGVSIGEPTLSGHFTGNVPHRRANLLTTTRPPHRPPTYHNGYPGGYTDFPPDSNTPRSQSGAIALHSAIHLAELGAAIPRGGWVGCLYWSADEEASVDIDGIAENPGPSTEPIAAMYLYTVNARYCRGEIQLPTVAPGNDLTIT